MTNSQEIRALKKEIKILNTKFEKLNQSYGEMIFSKRNKINRSTDRRSDRKISYINWLNKERKLIDLES